MASESTPPPTPGLPAPREHPRSPAVKRRGWVWLAVIAAALVGAGVVILMVRNPRPNKESERGRTYEVKTRVNEKDGLTYVWIPPGKFRMGCSAGDGECDKTNEYPAHDVTITRGFWIGQTEVTQAAYERVMGYNPSHFIGASLPVETIRWGDADRYCKAVAMRLPTEAEWEYAARGGDTSARYGPLEAVGWYSANSGNKTHEVKQKQPNGYGLYDTLGNVWEWVADWYDDKYYASSPASDPNGPSSGHDFVLRGGGWRYHPRDWRVSLRIGVDGGAQNDLLGVRCAGN